MRHLRLLTILLSLTASAAEPVIDVHLHALPYTQQGPPPLAMCTPMRMPAWSQQAPYAETFFHALKNPVCEDPVWSPTSDEELWARTLAELEKHNVYGVLSGPPELVAQWAEAAPDRFLRGLLFGPGYSTPSADEVIELHETGQLDILAEMATQYAGIAPDDHWLTPYWAALETNDIPAGIHMGPGPPGVLYLGAAGYRARLHSALTVEEVLVRHPKLRLFIGHAGFPMLDDLLALMYAHPQVYVGVGVIVYTQPRESFYRYLKGIVDAGFGKRVMFGSDQMVWPETIGRSIAVINEAPFLSEDQKRDILFNNAARFLRLSDEDVARMHAESRRSQ
jgi:predicted TIM-barrel fold metal-dependent hydrolase